MSGPSLRSRPGHPHVFRQSRASTLSPEPILQALEEYRGAFVDLDRATVVDAAAFHRGRQQLARQVACQPIASGERVVIAIANGPRFPAALGALLSHGACPILVHWRTPPQELLRLARQHGARTIICDGERQDDLASLGGRQITLSAESWLNLTCQHVDVSMPQFQAPGPMMAGVCLHPTSGTTNVPKIAARPGFCATEEARHYIERIGVDDTDVILTTPPMSHAYAYGMCVMVPVLSGATVVCLRSFKPNLVWQACKQFGVTIFPAVPAMLDALLFGASARSCAVPRAVLSAGSPLPKRTAVRFHKVFGTMVRPLYGTTETGGISVGFADGRLRCDGSVGATMSGVDVEVRPHAGAAAVGDGTGMLYVRSSSMMTGYVDENGEVDQSPVADGWFATGDLARLDEDGEIELLGRHSEVINVAGMKVIPSEVEQVIASMPGVVEVKVYPGRRKSGEQFVQAAVVLEGGVSVGSIREHCREHLVYYKRPERLHRLASLPRSPAGKIVVDQLP